MISLEVRKQKQPPTFDRGEAVNSPSFIPYQSFKVKKKLLLVFSVQCAIAYQFVIEFSHLGYRAAKEDESVVEFYHLDEQLTFI